MHWNTHHEAAFARQDWQKHILFCDSEAIKVGGILGNIPLHWSLNEAHGITCARESSINLKPLHACFQPSYQSPLCVSDNWK